MNKRYMISTMIVAITAFAGAMPAVAQKTNKNKSAKVYSFDGSGLIAGAHALGE